MSLRAAALPYRQQVAEAVGGSVVLRSDQPVTAASYTLHRDSVQVQASATATVTVVGGGVHVTCAVPASLPIDDGYEARLALTGGDVASAVVLYDVVRSPLGPLVSLDDMLAIRPTEGRYIEQAANTLQLTPDLFAESLAGRARAALEDMIRDRVVRLRDELGVAAETPGRRAGRELAYLRSRAILDVDRLQRVERLLAVAELYASKMRGGSEDGGDDPDTTLHLHYRREAKAAFEAMGPVRLDLDDDGAEDARTSFDGVVNFIRRQG